MAHYGNVLFAASFALCTLVQSRHTGTKDSCTPEKPKIKELLGTGEFFNVSDDVEWRRSAVNKLWEERKKMKFTPLVRLSLPPAWKSAIFLKNETASETLSLKHRYAWALFMWALVERKINQDTIVIEASSGNTAYSEAFMAKLLGLKHMVVVPDTLEKIKEEHITSMGSIVVKVPLADRLPRAIELEKALKPNAFFMNQFANSDKAEDYHSGGDGDKKSMNVMFEIVQQLRAEQHALPDWAVHAAGTGGTISSIGRFVRKHSYPTRVLLADPQYSAYADYLSTGRFSNETGVPLWVNPGMAGIGGGMNGPIQHGNNTSLDKSVIDAVIKIPDIASTAAMGVFRDHYHVHGGTSTGVNLLASLSLAASVIKPVDTIVTSLADSGYSYTSTYYNFTWIHQNFLKIGGIDTYYCWYDAILAAVESGKDPLKENGCRIK